MTLDRPQSATQTDLSFAHYYCTFNSNKSSTCYIRADREVLGIQEFQCSWG